MNLAKTAKQIAADPEAQYQALQRSLRRRKGFGLLFIQASPAKAQELLQRLQKDLPQKTIGTLTLTEPITNLYNLVAERPDLADLNILFIQGIEKSLEPDIKPGYGGEGDYYNLDTVPPLLSHLNQQRDNFRDHFGHLCFVFVVPPFALKYLIRRAADFLDWQSAIFTFADAHTEERQTKTPIELRQETDVIILDLEALLHILEGNAKYEAGDYDLAIAAYDQALALKPDNHEALYKKGDALRGLGQYEAAIAAYDQALALKPDNHEALNKKGVALGNLGQYEGAIAAYDQALAIKPDKHEALYNKGLALRNLGQYEGAIAAYDQALAIQPDYHKTLNNKGVALGNLGQYEAEIAAFDQALAIKPDFHEALLVKGAVLAYLGQDEVAFATFNAVLALKPNSYWAIYGKACCYGLQGDVENAINCLQKAIALEPECRAMAKTDTDFDPIRHDERFRALVEGQA